MLKKIVLVLAASLALPVFAQVEKDSYEMNPGCMWSASAGRCVVKSTFTVPLFCTVKISAKTERGIMIGNERKVRIEPRHYDDSARVFAAPGDTLKSVASTAECTTSQQ